MPDIEAALGLRPVRLRSKLRECDARHSRMHAGRVKFVAMGLAIFRFLGLSAKRAAAPQTRDAPPPAAPRGGSEPPLRPALAARPSERCVATDPEMQHLTVVYVYRGHWG